VEAGHCENERFEVQDDRKGGGLEVRRQCVDASETEEQRSGRSCLRDEYDWRKWSEWVTL
jgi:hypothetical protein